MPRWLRTLLTGLCFLWFSLAGGFIARVLLPANGLLLRRLDPLRRRRRQQRLLYRCHRHFMHFMRRAGVSDFRPPSERELPPLPPGPFVLVANHPTLVDVMMVLATIPGVCVLAKRSWFGDFWVGPLLRHAGHIPGPAEPAADDGEGSPVLDAIVARLRDGFPVLVFPEGSRSPRGGLRRFKRGAAEAALRARVPLLPLLLRCDPPSLTKGQRWYAVPDRRMHLTLDFLSSIDPAVEGVDSRALTRRLRTLYEERLGLRSPESS